MLKDFLGGSHYITEDELKEGVTEGLNNLAETEYAEDMQELEKQIFKLQRWKLFKVSGML